MVGIKVLDYIQELRQQKGKPGEQRELGISSLRDGLECLKEVDKMVECFEESSYLHDRQFLKCLPDQDIPVKIKLLNSQIKEKNEINEMLRESFFYLNRLRAAVLQKDNAAKRNVVTNFINNKYAGFGRIARELNDFKAAIDETDRHYSVLIGSLPKGIEHEISTVELCREHIEKLHNAQAKQKEIFTGIAKQFIKLGKKALPG